MPAANTKEPETPTTIHTPSDRLQPAAEKKLLPYEYIEPKESGELIETYAFRKFIYGGVGVVHDHVT